MVDETPSGAITIEILEDFIKQVERSTRNKPVKLYKPDGKGGMIELTKQEIEDYTATRKSEQH